MTKMAIGGHRGVGENLSSEKAASVVPAYRENTIKSFLRAVELGVDFVEFDVQVTKDGIAVIWHDDTLVQQLVVGAATVVSTEIKDMPLGTFREVTTSQSQRLVRHFRGAQSRSPVPEAVLPWSCQVDDRLPTLEEVFAAVPPTCGFDIELKMTNGPEVERTPPDEVARMVEATWDVVQRMGGPAADVGPGGSRDGAGQSAPGSAPSQQAGASSAGQRHIFFSSFDPDVCEAMSRKQQLYEVFFLSGCGEYTHADVRRTSIGAALLFALEKRLAGVVLPAKVLLKHESMATDAAALGLRLMTYGLENDDEDAVQKQQALDVAGIIVDDVQSMMSKRQQAK